MLHTHATERECIVVGSISPPDTNLISFLLLCHTLKKENAHSITAVLPYLAYSRHDKKSIKEVMRLYLSANYSVRQGQIVLSLLMSIVCM